MTQLLIDRATLKQLVVALEEVSDYINRYSIPAHQLELDPIDESIKTLNAALANAEPLTNVRTVTVSKFGVSFGNTTVSHERITGRNAEALNEGSGGVVSNEYMKWLNLPKDTL